MAPYIAYRRNCKISSIKIAAQRWTFGGQYLGHHAHAPPQINVLWRRSLPLGYKNVVAENGQKLAKAQTEVDQNLGSSNHQKLRSWSKSIFALERNFIS
jgi:hypothetical protein